MIDILGAPPDLVSRASQSRLLQSDLNVEIVPDGFIPLCVPVRQETSRQNYGGSDGWKAGVYHADGSVCDASLLDRAWSRVTLPFSHDDAKSADPLLLEGEAVYGGLILHQFGHFLLESTTRLWWPLRENFQGPIVFQLAGDRPPPPFVRRFLELAGVWDRVVFARGPLKFDSIIVPQRSFVIQKSVHKFFQTPFLEAARSSDAYALGLDGRFKGNSAGIFLSRLDYTYRRSFGEEQIEKRFEKNGYVVASTETMPLEHQIVIAKSNSSFAGIVGSAMHNLLFCDIPKNIIGILRTRLNTNYLMIDELMGNNSTYIYSHPKEQSYERIPYESDITLNVDDIQGHLDALGIR